MGNAISAAGGNPTDRAARSLGIDTVSHFAWCSAEPALDCGCEITEARVTDPRSDRRRNAIRHAR